MVKELKVIFLTTIETSCNAYSTCTNCVVHFCVKLSAAKTQNSV
ncbi:hypothetical protein TERTU_4122 [Teredinibacter turnerae T7901]|uniref:Uncharacterized protein n=1 Tax=Teredinibacter turnerae (strain ATCC 39867 / T7901) TaxID=377629 RepID=C5BUH2_TERTT|nr:hypothetical protein TERTU_4122 [Teredinibacter turnerae T7901]